MACADHSTEAKCQEDSACCSFCAFLKPHLALNAFIFVLKVVGLCARGSGLLRKAFPALPNWHRMSGHGRLPPPLQRVPIETRPPAKILGPRSDPGPWAEGRSPAKFSKAGLLLGCRPGSVLASYLERGHQSSDDP